VGQNQLRLAEPWRPPGPAPRGPAPGADDLGEPQGLVLVAKHDQFAALLPVRERISGPEHPDTLAARGDLARWARAAVNSRRYLRELLLPPDVTNRR